MCVFTFRDPAKQFWRIRFYRTEASARQRLITILFDSSISRMRTM
jgi:hypothetical protein